MADQDRSHHQLEEAAACAAAEAAFAHIGDRMAAMPLQKRRVIRPGAAAEVRHRDRFLLQKGGCGHAAILALRAWRSNRKKHLEQGLAGCRARALDRKQPALGDSAAVRGNLVRVAAGFEDAMTGNDDHERVAGNRLRDRVRGARSPESGGDFAVGAGFPMWNRTGEFVNALIERRYAAHIECDVGEIGWLAAQQRDDTFDRDLDTQRRTGLAGLGVLAQHSPPGFDLPRPPQLHAHNPETPACAPASAASCIESCAPTPRHYASHPGGTIAPSQTGAWKIRIRLRY